MSPDSGREATLQQIYQEVYQEILASCEGRDRQEFVALCPKFTAMNRSFYRYRKDARDRISKNEEGEVGEKDVDSTDFDNDATPMVERTQTEIKFISTTTGNGKIYHYFINNLYKFYRNKTKPNGRAFFPCTVNGCKAQLRAYYTSYTNRNVEEPSFNKSSVPPSSSHVLKNGRLHPAQPGLRQAEEARRRMRKMVEENPIKKVGQIYKEVRGDILENCEEADKEEVEAMFPTHSSMERSMFKWRKWCTGVPA